MFVGNKFPTLPRKPNMISLGSHKNNNSLCPDEFLIKLKHYFNQNLSHVSYFSAVSLL